MPRLRRRTWVIAAGVIAVVLIAALLLPSIAARVVRAQLQNAISEQLDARLSLASVEWLPPYGIRLRDARVVATDGSRNDFDLVTAKQIELSLARSPLWPGPLSIERIDVRSPTVHLIQTSDGLVGQRIVRNDGPVALRKQKLSELFELRSLAVADAQVVYDDRTIAGSVPLVWRGLRLDLKTTWQGPAVYGFDATADGGKSATLAAAGTVDIDRLHLTLASCDARVVVDPAAAESSLPATVQAALRDAHVSGTLHATLAGELPLSDPRQSVLDATIELPHAAGRLPGATAAIDELSVKLMCRADPKSLAIHLEKFAARRGDTAIEATVPTIMLDVATGTIDAKRWTLHVTPGRDRDGLPRAIADALAKTEIAGAIVIAGDASGPIRDWKKGRLACQVEPDALAARTSTLPAALRDFAPFALSMEDGVARLRGVRAAYGNDVLFVREARVALAASGRLRFDKLAGCVTFDAERATYPPVIESLLADAEPRGPFFFDGTAAVDLATSSLDYQFRVTSDRAALSPMRRRVPVTNVVADLLVTPKRVTIDRFESSVLAGTLGLTGTVRLEPDVAFGLAVRLRRIDLNGLAYLATGPGEKPMTIAGELDADVTCAGTGLGDALLGSLRADGALRIDRGELFHVPTLEAITRPMGLRNAATLSEASATFALADRVIRVADVSIGSPAVGVRASGTIGLDKRLDIQAIATPLSDWEKGLRRTGDNAVANVAANVAGSVQHAMNRVTEDFLYRVHVTGTTDQPDVRVIAAPALRGAAK